VQRIRDEVLSFAGSEEAADDVAILVLRWTGEGPSRPPADAGSGDPRRIR